MRDLALKKKTDSRSLASWAVLAATLSATVGGASCVGPQPAPSPEDEDGGFSDDLSIGGEGTGSGGSSPDQIGKDQDGGRTELTSDQVKEVLGAECTGWSQEGEALPATLQLVVDTSGSMTDQPPGEDERSKWDITRAALEKAIATLPASTNLGVLYYPNKNVTSNGATPGDVNACVKTDAALPIAPLGNEGSDQRDAFAASLEAASIESYTATFDAYSYALDKLLVPYDGPNKFILLITDGAPTIDGGCTWPGEPVVEGELYDGAGSMDGHTDPIVEAIGAAYQSGVRTYLIGSPGSEESVESGTDKRPWLSHAALKGGTAPPGCMADGPDYCHFDMTQETDFSASLSAALADISGQIIDECTFEVPDPPTGATIAPGLTQVIIEWGSGSSSLIRPDGNGECVDGWQFDSQASTIKLCSQTCSEIQADPGARLFLSFGCTDDDLQGILK
jgi:hypothetical protein